MGCAALNAFSLAAATDSTGKRSHPMTAQASEELLYAPGRARDQIRDDRDRVGASLHHSGALGPGDASNRNQWLIRDAARCPTPLQANYRIRSLLGRGREDRPDGNIVHWADVRAEQLTLSVCRY